MTSYTISAGVGALGVEEALSLSRYLARYPESRYRKYFGDNPAGVSLGAVAHDGDGNPIGMAALHPRRLLVDGKPVSAAIVGDFVVVPAHRTVGLALRIQRSLLELAQTSGVELIVGEPNEQARGLMERIGYRPLAPRSRYVRFFARDRPGHSLGRRAAYSGIRVADRTLGLVGPERWARRSWSTEWIDRFDDRFLPAWSASSQQSTVVSERTPALLNWRYELAAGTGTGRFRVAAVFQGQSVAAYAVVEGAGPTWRIVEIAGIDGRSQAALLGDVLAEAREGAARAVVVSAFALPHEVIQVLRWLQFVRRQSSTWLLVREVGATVPWWSTEAAGWTFLSGDLDL